MVGRNPAVDNPKPGYCPECSTPPTDYYYHD